MEKYLDALQACNESLKLNKNNCKTYYRKSKTLKELKIGDKYLMIK